jgi:ATP-dependent Clp protease ATP-binding subunit ClpC
MNSLTPKTLAFITCSACNGSGTFGKSACPHCAGYGVGAFFDNHFLYFEHRLSTSLIRSRAIKKVVDTVINTIAYLLFLSGLVTLGWWMYTSGHLITFFTDPTLQSLKTINFWGQKSNFLLLFWISLIPGLFIFYRLSRFKENQPHILPLSYSFNKSVAPTATWEDIKSSKIKKINVREGSDEVMLTIYEQAYLLAKKFKHNNIEALHFFAVAIFCSRQVRELIDRLSIDEKKLTAGFEHQLVNHEKTSTHVNFGKEAKEIIIEAYVSAKLNSRRSISALDILIPSFDRDPKISELFFDLEADRTKLENGVLWLQLATQLQENNLLYRKMARFKPSSNMDRAYTALATPLLDHFSYDWTLAAKWGRVDLCLEREKEIRKIFDTVEKGQNGLILVGPRGVGKSTIVGGLAQKMVLEDVPKLFQDKRLIEVDLARLIGGLDSAEAEERLLDVIGEVARARNIILYIKDIEKIMGISSGNEGSLDLAGVLADAISRGLIFCVASVTNENYQKYVEKTLLGSLLAKIDVMEPDSNTAIRMVESKINQIENEYGVYFSYNSLAEVVNLTSRYLHDTYLPGKAMSVLESVAVSVARQENKIVDREAIATVITELTHIPVTKLTENESEKLLHLEKRIHERVVGQEEAIEMVSAALRRARVELRENKRPIANFLFLGPTGVGKTELAKAVTSVYFGKEEYMIRIDMSEYQNSDAVNKMIGSPEGVTGYLTEAVRKMPFSLILLDEIEKAHPDILNLFLQVMDDGRLTDGQGKTIDFTNSIIIATSNIGSVLIQETVREEGNLDELKEQLVNTELVKSIHPELINRFDGVIIFKPLTSDEVIAITKLLLRSVENMVTAKGYNFQISEAGIKELAQLGFHPEFGARPLRRLIQEKIEDSIATKILENALARRDTIVFNDELRISITKAPTL